MKKAQGELAPFPPLTELHCELFKAKERFDEEKRTWKTNHCGVLDCEKVAPDAYNIAVSTHFDAH